MGAGSVALPRDQQQHSIWGQPLGCTQFCGGTTPHKPAVPLSASSCQGRPCKSGLTQLAHLLLPITDTQPITPAFQVGLGIRNRIASAVSDLKQGTPGMASTR